MNIWGNAKKETVLWKNSWPAAYSVSSLWPPQTWGQTNKEEGKRQLKEAEDTEMRDKRTEKKLRVNKRAAHSWDGWMSSPLRALQYRNEMQNDSISSTLHLAPKLSIWIRWMPFWSWLVVAGISEMVRILVPSQWTHLGCWRRWLW